MATFRIALVLACLMAVGATTTCPDGAASETCSQLDAASLIQLPATVVKVDVLESKANTKEAAAAYLGALHGETTIDCYNCMDDLQQCIADMGGASTSQVTNTNSPPQEAGSAACDAFNAALEGVDSANTVLMLCTACQSGNSPLACAMPGYDRLCAEGSSGNMPLPGIVLQQEATHTQGDAQRACINPSVDNPKTWACDCMAGMVEACQGESNQQACFTELMCADERIASIWKTTNCDGQTGCGNLLVEANTSMEARAKEAHVKEDTPSQALDESLSGKREC